MSKHDRIAKRLVLKTETLRNLSRQTLDHVNGGNAQSNANGSPCIQSAPSSPERGCGGGGGQRTAHTACTTPVDGCPPRQCAILSLF